MKNRCSPQTKTSEFNLKKPLYFIRKAENPIQNLNAFVVLPSHTANKQAYGNLEVMSEQRRKNTRKTKSEALA